MFFSSIMAMQNGFSIIYSFIQSVFYHIASISVKIQKYLYTLRLCYQRFYCTKSKESTGLHHLLVGVISLTDRHGTDKMSPPLFSLSNEPHGNVCPQREANQHPLGGWIAREKIFKYCCQISCPSCKQHQHSQIASCIPGTSLI